MTGPPCPTGFQQLWLAFALHPGWGVAAGWFLLVNALGHLGQALALRSPNPGLWTGLGLFLPLGTGLLIALQGQAIAGQHLVSVAAALLLHLGILLRLTSNRRRAPG